MILVLNKIDRLILELRLSPQQAYERMKAIITQVNMIISAFQSEQYMSEADTVLGLQDAAAARFSIDSPLHPTPLPVTHAYLSTPLSSCKL